jgi:hypothetical protein
MALCGIGYDEVVDRPLSSRIGCNRFRGTKYGRANVRFDVLELYCYANANITTSEISWLLHVVGLNGAWIEMKQHFNQK